MSFQDTVSKEVFTVAGTTRSFAFAHPYFDKSEIKCFLLHGGTQTALTVDSDYTVSAADGTGCVVTLAGTVGAVGDTLAVLRQLALQQTTDIPSQGKLDPEDVENQFDRDVMVEQQLAEEISRCVKVPVTSDEEPEELLPTCLAARDQAVAAGTVCLAAAGTATNAASAAAAYAEEAKHVSGITEHNADGTAHAGGFSHAVAVQGNTHLAQSAFPLYEPGTDITVAPSTDVYYSLACAQLANSKKLVDFGGKRQADGTTMAYISVGRSDGAGENAVFFYITSAGVKGISGAWYLADFTCATPGGTSSNYSVANKEYVDNAVTALGGSIASLVHELRGADVTETVISGGTFALNTEYGYESATEVSASFDFPSGYGSLVIAIAAPPDYDTWFYANQCYTYAGDHGAVLHCVVPALYRFKFIGSGSGVSITGRTATVWKLQAKA